MKLLYMMNSDRGGMADYGLYQALALRDQNVDVTFLCSPGYIHQEKLQGITVIPQLYSIESRKIGKIKRRVNWISKLVGDIKTLCQVSEEVRPDTILFSSYYEYLSPLWAWRIRGLKKKMPMQIASVIHDPVRNFQVGPKWWHEWSIREAYSFLDHAFLHEKIGIPFSEDKTFLIPQGIYQYPEPSKERWKVLSKLNIPTDSLVLLSFGFIRDGKNLDLLIQSLKELPKCHLIIAGHEQSGSQKGIEYYQSLAEKAGVKDRCHWQTKFIPDQEAADLFNASDLIALTYSASFRSASAVANIAARYRKPVIASGGQGNLQKIVKDYCLGIWVEPDSQEAIIDGVQDFTRNPPLPDYHRFIEENSWERNARIVKDAFLHR